MAFPTFLGAGTFRGSASTIVNLDYPAGIAANDIALLFVESENEPVSLISGQEAGFAVLGTPAGQGTASATTASRMTIFWKRLVGGDAVPQVADAGDHVAARIGVWRGVDTGVNPTAPVYTHDATADTQVVATGITTAWDDALVIIAVANVLDQTTGLTVTYTQASLANLGGTGMGDNTNQGTGGGLNVGTGEKAVAGATGNITVDFSAATQKTVAVFALKGAVVTTPLGETLNTDTTKYGSAIGGQLNTATFNATTLGAALNTDS